MIRTLVASIAIFGFAACGDDENEGVDIATLFPADNAIGSWIEDSAATGFSGPNPAGVEIANNNAEANDAVNGDVVPFEVYSFVAFGREFYTDGTAKLELRIWEMPNVAESTGLFDNLPSEDARYDISWETASFGDAARMIDTGVSYWYNVRKGIYFVEIMGLAPNDAPTKTAGETFLTTVLANVP